MTLHRSAQGTASPFSGQNGAVISDDQKYRYALWRGPESVPVVVWCMLNPSKADASVDDPTIRKVRGFSQRCMPTSISEIRAGVNHRLIVVNLYGLRSTEPENLFPPRNTYDGHPQPDWDPVGPHNDEYIALAFNEALVTGGKIVFAWGQHKAPKIDERIQNVERLLPASMKACCLEGRTKSGRPKHPLMQGYDTPFVEYTT